MNEFRTMRRVLATVACIIFMAMGISAKEEHLTPTITWELSDTGILTIRGTGAMPDFDSFQKPTYWRQKKYTGKIKEIIVGEGITRVGDSNFAGAQQKGNDMASVKKIKLPSSLVSIGSSAFVFTGAEEIEMGGNVEKIFNFAFASSRNLKAIILPPSLKEIWNSAFSNCDNLEAVDFSDAHVALGYRAFAGDSRLSALKNASHISFDSALGDKTANFATVFPGTKLNEDNFRISDKESADDELMASVNSVSSKTDESELIVPFEKGNVPGGFPDKTWEKSHSDGGMIYGETIVITKFNRPDSGLSVNEIPAPYGYMEFYGEGGDNTAWIFKDCRINGNKASFSADVYSMDYDSEAEKEIFVRSEDVAVMTAVYNPADGSLDLKTKSKDYEDSLHFLNPDRQKYVQITKGHNVNIRRTPESGATVGKSEKGQVFKLKSIKDITRNDVVRTWYEISLPDGSSGYVSGEFATIADDEDGWNPASFGSEPFDKGGYYTEPIKGPEDDIVGSRSYSFTRLGNRVLMVADEIYLNGRIHGCYYAIGRIDGNSIVFNKGIYDQGGMAGADEAFENGDFKTLESLMTPEDEHRLYYSPGNLYYLGEELEFQSDGN